MQSQDHFSRRTFLETGTLASAGLLAEGLSTSAAEPANSAKRPLRIVCVGGHPDDPESGCAGTLARYSDAGHAPTVIYLTRGERGIRNTSLEAAGRVGAGVTPLPSPNRT